MTAAGRVAAEVHPFRTFVFVALELSKDSKRPQHLIECATGLLSVRGDIVARGRNIGLSRHDDVDTLLPQSIALGINVSLVPGGNGL